MYDCAFQKHRRCKAQRGERPHDYQNPTRPGVVFAHKKTACSGRNSQEKHTEGNPEFILKDMIILIGCFAYTARGRKQNQARGHHLNQSLAATGKHGNKSLFFRGSGAFANPSIPPPTRGQREQNSGRSRLPEDDQCKPGCLPGLATVAFRVRSRSAPLVKSPLAFAGAGARRGTLDKATSILYSDRTLLMGKCLRALTLSKARAFPLG
jgi:hypothetical protein